MANLDDASQDESYQIKPRTYDSTRSQRTLHSQGLLYFDNRDPEASFYGLETFSNEYYRNFITGSSYRGQWNALGMNGNGRYTMPHGVVYEGGMKDGQFHGEGKLIYPKGQELIGHFYKGTMISSTFKFRDGLSCVLEDYLKFPDRRYLNAIVSGKFDPPGRERQTISETPRKIPEGHYDVGDGFYDPKTKWVYSYNEYEDPEVPGLVPVRAPLRFVKPRETKRYDLEDISLIKDMPFVPIYQDEEFILSHCRKAWDEPTGYRPDLNEVWMSGRKEEAEALRAEVIPNKQGNEEESMSIKLLHHMKEVVEQDGVKHSSFSEQPNEDEKQK
ncbi:hypothetical protein WA026_004120 [Henosepilachna vigintioctopunctata]|uniref:MORN repeat-containing protein 5 n=1 Tax=Henosepilachna vigintioctopunctata TaxID=420089 RepID=A0AAW1UGM1_9CUCU